MGSLSIGPGCADAGGLSPAAVSRETPAPAPAARDALSDPLQRLIDGARVVMSEEPLAARLGARWRAGALFWNAPRPFPGADADTWRGDWLAGEWWSRVELWRPDAYTLCEEAIGLAARLVLDCPPDQVRAVLVRHYLAITQEGDSGWPADIRAAIGQLDLVTATGYLAEILNGRTYGDALSILAPPGVPHG